MFICGSLGLPWAYNCLWNKADPGQYFPGSLVTPFSAHPGNETCYWTSSVNRLTGVAQALPGYIPNGDEYLFGYTLLPLWGVATHQHFHNLSKLLIIIVNETGTLFANLQKFFTFSKVVLENQIVLIYRLNNKEMYDINTSSQVETSITKIRQQAPWL